MSITFKKATKTSSRLRLAVCGPAGGGKTFTSLKIAKHLGGKTAVIDTERGSASKYADLFDFDVIELTDFSPANYVEAIGAAAKHGYQNVIVDSLTHAWSGKGGALEMVDQAAAKSQSKNSFAAWRSVTPEHNALVDAMLQSPCNVLVTMRSKMEYVLEEDEKGRKMPVKKGMAPIQREGMEYEFDVVLDMTVDNAAVVTKTRCPDLAGKVFKKPGEELANTIKAWLGSGSPPPEPKAEGASHAAPSASPPTPMYPPNLYDMNTEKKKLVEAVSEWINIAAKDAANICKQLVAKQCGDEAPTPYTIHLLVLWAKVQKMFGTTLEVGLKNLPMSVTTIAELEKGDK